MKNNLQNNHSKKCIECDHFVQSGMCMGTERGYCFKWTWINKNWYIVDETYYCEQFKKRSSFLRVGSSILFRKIPAMIMIIITGKNKFKNN